MPLKKIKSIILIIFFLTFPKYGFLQSILPFTISTDLIDLKNVFPGQRISKFFKIKLDQSIKGVLNYKFLIPSSVFCNSILFKPEEKEDSINSSFLKSETDKEDIWELIIQVPEIRSKTLKKENVIETSGEYSCDIGIEIISFTVPSEQVPQNIGGGGGGGGFIDILQPKKPEEKKKEFIEEKKELVELGVVENSFRIKEVGKDYFIIEFNTTLPAFVRIIFDKISHKNINKNLKNYGYKFSTRETKDMGSYFEIKLTDLEQDSSYYFRIVMRTKEDEAISKEFYVKTKKKEYTKKEIPLKITKAEEIPREKEEKQPQEITFKPEKKQYKLTLASMINFLKNIPIELWFVIVGGGVLFFNFFVFKKRKRRRKRRR